MRDLNIVVMDGATLTMGDLDWSRFERLGNLTVYERTQRDKIIDRARGANVVITNKVPFFAQEFNALPEIRYIGVLATGYNNIDIKEAANRNIEVTNIPAYGTDSVVQNVFAHILNIANSFAVHTDAVRSGKWNNSRDFCMVLRPQFEISGRTLGIIGFGKIGRGIARAARGFGMNVISYSPSRNIGTSEEGAKFVSLDELFSTSDIISLACVLNDKTEKIINAESIGKMRRGAWLINTGRGGLVDESALCEALKNGHIGAAGLDVLSVEPPKNGNPLIDVPNCFITPHIAWATREARERLVGIAFENLSRWSRGETYYNSVLSK